MVGVFASLKWRLVRTRLASGNRAATVAGLLVLFVLAVGLAGLLVWSRAAEGVSLPLVATVFTLQLVAWVLTPLVAFGVDETVDPSRFALLPLRLPTLQRGLLTTALIGYLPIANAVLLLGAVLAISQPWWVLPIALVCGVLQLLTCVVLSRAAATSMSSLMSSRRGRDLGMLVGFLIFALYMGLSLLLNTGNENAIGAGTQRLADVLTWGPPGNLAVLPALIGAGDWGRAALALVIGVAPLPLGWWWWRRALARSLTSIGSTTASSAPAGTATDTAVGGSTVGTMQVVAGRDRLLLWRDPMRRMPWLLLILLTFLYPFIVSSGPEGVFWVAFGAILVGTQAGNQYGMDGSGLWLHLMTITDRARARGEVLGHVIVAVVPGVVVIAASLVLQGVVRDAWHLLLPAAGVSLAAMLGGCAASSYLSARIPYAVPQSRKSMFASSVAGQKGVSARATFATLGLSVLLAVPSAVAAFLAVREADWWGWVSVLLALVIGGVALVWAVRATADRYLARGPEILAVVAAGDRA